MSHLTVVSARIPIQGNDFRMHVYTAPEHAGEHIALTLGSIENQIEPVLLRVHSECLTGDLFGSERCDCGWQLQEALQQIIELGSGILVYLRQEGRGIGLIEKLRAYNLQEQGLDTIEANQELGHPSDGRSYTIAADILKALGVANVKLLTNNPDKINELRNAGIAVEQRVPLVPVPGKENFAYLFTKQTRMNHLLDLARGSHAD